MSQITTFFAVLTAILSIQSCRSVESKSQAAMSQRSSMTSCEVMSQCNNPALVNLISTTQETAARGSAYLQQLEAADAATYRHLSRLLVANDLEYAEQTAKQLTQQGTNPDLEASDSTRLTSQTSKGPSAGVGTLILLTPSSETAKQSTFLALLKDRGMVSQTTKGTTLSKDALWGSATNRETYLGWDFQSLAKAESIAKLNQTAAAAAKYSQETRATLKQLSSAEKDRLLSAASGLLKEIHLDAHKDLPKNGVAYALLSELRASESQAE